MYNITRKRAFEEAFIGDDNNDGNRNDAWEAWREPASTPTTPTKSSSKRSGTPSTQARNKRRLTQHTRKKREEENQITSRFTNLEYLGRSVPTGILDKELKFADRDPVFDEFMKLNPSLFTDVNVDAWRFVEANSVVELNHLERFDRTYTEMPAKFTNSVELALSYVSFLLTLDVKLVFPTKEALADVRFWGDKYAGVEYALQGYRTRSSANDAAQVDAEMAWEKLMAGEYVAPHTNRMGGRGKLVSMEKLERTKDKPTAGRLIFMTSHRDLKLNGVTEQLVTTAYKDPRYPISVGKAWWKGGCAEFLNRFSDYELFSCFDAEKYDSSLPPWLIAAAMDIIREQFVDGMNPKYDAYWKFVVDGLIFAPVYLDNGMMFRRQGGSTSGHSYNTLMQSVATLIVVYTCFFELMPIPMKEQVPDMVWAESLGDDQHTGARGECGKLQIEALAEVAMECFGVSWWGDKSFNTTRLLDDEVGAFQGTQYLGKYFRRLDEKVEGLQVRGVVPYRPFSETVLRLIYPERGTMGRTESWMRAVGHYADSAGNPRTRAMMEAYLDWLEPQVEADTFNWTEKWKRKFSNQERDGEVPVPTRRISYIEWLGLILLDN